MRVAAIGILFGCLAAGATAAAGEELKIVVAYEDGSHVAAKLPLSEQALARATHLWAWTSKQPPVRRALEVRSFDAADVLAELGRIQSRRVEMVLRGWSRREQLESARVIVAPAEMWNSVPESLLPAFPLSEEGRVIVPVRDPARVRVIGDGLGTSWLDISRSSMIELVAQQPSTDANVIFRGSDGRSPGRVDAIVMSRRSGDPAPTVRARFVADERGALRIPALPATEVITLFVLSEHAAPQTISGTAPDLSRVIALPAPAAIRGRFVDEKDRPISGATIEVEGWVSADAPVASRNDAVSDADGRFVVPSLPRSMVMARATAPGRATYRKQVSLKEGDVDLGPVVLARALDVLLTVSDANGEPLHDVAVEADNGFRGVTNREGQVKLLALSASEETGVTLSADGYTPHELRLVPPLPKQERVQLDRAFSIHGKLVDEQGNAVQDGVAIVSIGSRYRREMIGTDGRFSTDVTPGEDFEVSFESSRAAPVTRKEDAGRPGEQRDLGTIQLPAGLSVRGHVVDDASAPVAGARVWTIRPGRGGVVAAWAARRFAQTTTDSDGRFELRGLTGGPAVIRIDAPGFSRASRDVLIEDAGADIGAIALTRGTTVAVEANRPDATLARLDLRGHGLDADMLTAPVTEGVAHLRDVPPGRHQVSVVAGHSIVCERTVQVKDGMDASVECPPPQRLRGRVLVGGAPAFGGTLTWVQPGQTDALIDNRRSPLGALQQRIYGLGGGIVVIPVLGDGSFESDQLRPGSWHVGWRSAEGVRTSDQPFTVPEQAAEIVVAFDGSVIRGRIVDERGKPVAGARIREIEGPLHAMAAGDGSFTIMAVPAGTHRLQAALGGRTSAIVDVHVEAGKQVPEILLQIGSAEREVLSIDVLGMHGEPMPGAFVFVELNGGVVKTLIADASGVATTSVAEGLPLVTRLAAFAGNRWAFSDIRPAAGEAPRRATVRFERTGDLTIRSRTVSGSPQLFSARSPADVAWMYSRLGSFISLTPESPVVVRGVPPGTYEIHVLGHRAVASIVAGSNVTIDLP